MIEEDGEKMGEKLARKSPAVRLKLSVTENEVRTKTTPFAWQVCSSFKAPVVIKVLVLAHYLLQQWLTS